MSEDSTQSPKPEEGEQNQGDEQAEIKPESSLEKGSGEPAPMEKEAQPQASTRPSFAFFAALAGITIALDLGSKWWVKATLDDGRPWSTRKIELIHDRLAFIFAKNRGGAWGLLQDEHEAIRLPFFFLISVVAVVFILSLYRKAEPAQRALRWGLPLVFGGAIGNVVDRIRYGYVVDFIDVFVTKDFRWPTFNVADIAIVAGVGLMAIDMFTARTGANQDLATAGVPIPEAKPAPEAANAPEADESADKAAQPQASADKAG